MSLAPQTGKTPLDGRAPLTEELFLADRQKFWGDFTGATTGAVIFLIVLLVAMAFFLV